MTYPPEEEMNPVPPPNEPHDDETPSSRHDAEETAPAFNPMDPESSWMAFLAPPSLDLEEDALTVLVEGELAVPDAPDVPDASDDRHPPLDFDPDATAASFNDSIQSWLAQHHGDADETIAPLEPIADPDPLAEYNPVIPQQDEPVVAGLVIELVEDLGMVEQDDADSLPVPPEAISAPDSVPLAGGVLPVADAAAPAEAPVPPASAAESVSQERSFEDLTIAEMLGQLRRSPGSTFDALLTVLQSAPPERRSSPARAPRLRPALAAAGAAPRPAIPVPMPVPAPRAAPTGEQGAESEDRAASSRGVTRIALLIAAFGLAAIGTSIMQNSISGSETDSLYPGVPWLIAALVVAVIAELIGGVLRPNHRKDVELRSISDEPERIALPALGGRVTTGLLGAAASILSLLLNSGNTFTVGGVIAWLLAVFFWVWTFAPQGWTPVAGLRTLGSGFSALGHIKLGNPTFIALIAIMALGAYLRLVDLDLVPREMTSDHVEFILDVNRVLNGQTSVFFGNIGGREPIQFYLLAALSSIPGLGLTFTTQKLLTAIEGVLLLPILWWLGRELIGPRQPRLGNLTGLLMAALTAVSYWALILSRIGERIALTPIAVSLILIFLIRALRYGRRWDFILTGIFLGFGLYTYQAVRMLPVIIVGGVALVGLAHLRNWRVRGSMLENLGILTLIAFVIFVPLLGYSLENPEDFWRRTSGRLFGDEVTQETNEAGEIVYRTPSLQERAEAFVTNLPTLTSNLRNAILMYNWKGDVGWFQNYPNEPAFDIVTGGLLVVGAGAWIGRMLRRRDPGDWTIMLAFWVLLLPSALSIAYPIENPSFTRMSGTLPIVFLWAAYPLAQLLALPSIRLTRLGVVFGALIAAVVVVSSASVTNTRYFTLYNLTYLDRSLPHSAAGELLETFASSGYGYGNAFMIAYENWWDHRAVGLEAGRMDWPNTIPDIDTLPRVMQAAAMRPPDSPYRLNVNYDLLFFVNQFDAEALIRLGTWFPSGYTQDMTPYQTEDRYRVFRVPALSEDGFNAFLQDAGVDGS